MPAPENRPRGILTPNDRSLLLGHNDYKHQQQYSDRRRTIRKRITNGILDFSTIQYLLRERDRKRIFDDPARAADIEEAQFHESIRAMLYWTYFGLKEQNYDFSSLLSEAIERAETDFAREYSGRSVDISVQFDVDVTRSHDIDDVISLLEKGGPIHSNRLYDLLQMSGGVPIDTSKLDTVRVRFQSSYPKGEKAVLETMFSEYLGVDVEINDAVARAELDDDDFIDGESASTNAVTDPDHTRPDPSEIRNYQPTPSFPEKEDFDEHEFDDKTELERMRSKRKKRRDGDVDNSGEDGPSVDGILDEYFEDLFSEGSDSTPPSLRHIAENRNDYEYANDPIAPESVVELLEIVKEQFASTPEVAAACGCAPDAARQALTALFEDDVVSRRYVTDTNGHNLTIWWLRES